MKLNSLLVWLIFVITVLSIAGVVLADCDAADALVAKAKKIFSQKNDVPTADKAIVLCLQAVKQCPEQINGFVLLSQLYWERGDWLPRNQKTARMNLFKKGEAAADKALAIDPNNGKALYWKTTNMAAIADMEGWTKSLWMFKTLRQNMLRVDELEPHYDYGATSRFWCEVLARVPLFLAGRFGFEPADVVAELEKEIVREPRYFANYVYAARVYWKLEQKEKALSHLEYVLKNNPNIMPSELGPNTKQKQIAAQLWKEYTGKTYPGR